MWTSMTTKHLPEGTVLFKELYDGSAMTFIGIAPSEFEAAIAYIASALEKEGFTPPKQFYTFSGKEMNEYYNLEGNNKYQDDLGFIAFKLDGVGSVGKLAMFRLRMDGHWFDDIVDNNERRSNKR